jgi:putative Holliday junction resolvase
MRYLALDLGNRRIGLATGSDESVPVVPAGHLERKTLRQDLDRVLAAAEERDAGAIVVGMPYSLSGDSGPQARLAEGFVRELRKRTSLPVHTVDERFSSVEAEGLLRESGAQPGRRKGDMDSLAAVLILERFLNREQHQR